jgi:hypothetical protein
MMIRGVPVITTLVMSLIKKNSGGLRTKVAGVVPVVMGRACGHDQNLCRQIVPFIERCLSP